MGVFLFRRILSEGHDSRFDRIRHKPARFAVVFVFQAIWVSLQLLPVMALNAVPAAALPRLATADLLGLSLWASGFALEVVADGQKTRWRRDRELKLHDEEFLTSGLYSLRLVITHPSISLPPCQRAAEHASEDNERSVKERPSVPHY